MGDVPKTVASGTWPLPVADHEESGVWLEENAEPFGTRGVVTPAGELNSKKAPEQMTSATSLMFAGEIFET
jgi:hypothetical protein